MTEVSKLRKKKGWTYRALANLLHENHEDYNELDLKEYGTPYRIRRFFNGWEMPSYEWIMAFAGILWIDPENLELLFQQAYDEKHPKKSDVMEGQIDISEIEEEPASDEQLELEREGFPTLRDILKAAFSTVVIVDEFDGWDHPGGFRMILPLSTDTRVDMTLLNPNLLDVRVKYFHAARYHECLGLGDAALIVEIPYKNFPGGINNI